MGESESVEIVRRIRRELMEEEERLGREEFLRRQHERVAKFRRRVTKGRRRCLSLPPARPGGTTGAQCGTAAQQAKGCPPRW